MIVRLASVTRPTLSLCYPAGVEFRCETERGEPSPSWTLPTPPLGHPSSPPYPQVFRAAPLPSTPACLVNFISRHQTFRSCQVSHTEFLCKFTQFSTTIMSALLPQIGAPQCLQGEVFSAILNYFMYSCRVKTGSDTRSSLR